MIKTISSPRYEGVAKVAALVGLMVMCCSGAMAQVLPFPQPDPATAAASVSQFTTRAMAVIETNACGREDDFLAFRDAMSSGNYDSEGEDLSHILVAKIAFIRFNPHTANTLCVQHILRAKADFEKHVQLAAKFPVSACATEVPSDPSTSAADPVDVTVSVTPSCMSVQLDDSITAMKKTQQMGSSGIPCVSAASLSSDGEFDVNVREYARILYLSGSVGQRDGTLLNPSTIDYMYNNLLAARGGLSPSSYPMLLGCSEPAGDSLGSPEDTVDRTSWTHDVWNFLGHFLEWLILSYLTYGLVPGGAPLVIAPFLLGAATGNTAEFPLAHWEIYVSETENHRLNIETSKYLINADIIARLEAEDYDGVDELKADQAEVRGWLLRRLQDITANDFQEYNARPYSRYSLNSLINLNDFAGVHDDKDLGTAAQVVLDLSAAKFAATSNRGRRVVPFRRRSNEDGDDSRYLYEAIQGADHEVVRSMLLTGQVGLLDQSLQNKGAVMAEMVNTATSSYQVPAAALLTAIQREPFEQIMRHTSVEKVEQAPAFTISAGGIRTGPTATLLGFASDVDKGVAMPTVVIPTIAGSYMRDLFRFNGGGSGMERLNNTCVSTGFACGIQPELSEAFKGCTQQTRSGDVSIYFVRSSDCFPGPGPHFYLAAMTSQCSSCPNAWGIFDVIDATPSPLKPPPSYEIFQSQRTAAFNAVTLHGQRGTYTTAAGQTIEFVLEELDSWGRVSGSSIVTIDGNPPPPWSTTGGRIEADGMGNATITAPSGPVEVISFPPPPVLGGASIPTKTVK